MATQERQDAQDDQAILPYWVQDHIHGETKLLIRVRLEWKSKDGFRPGTNAVLN